MPTLLAVHAHPDDECISTGGILARYAAEGVRTILVTCTDGAVGEISDPALATPDNLVEVRSRELDASVKALNISRLVKLGYRDSGMAGTPSNDDPRSFHVAPLAEAAERLAVLLREERPDVVVTYTSDGTYGHPDHIKAHHTTLAVVDLVEHEGWQPAKVYLHAVPRSFIQQMTEQAVRAASPIRRSKAPAPARPRERR